MVTNFTTEHSSAQELYHKAQFCSETLPQSTVLLRQNTGVLMSSHTARDQNGLEYG
jgi:hypothetical protein